MTNRLTLLPGGRGRVAVVHSLAGQKHAERLLTHLLPMRRDGVHVDQVVLPDDPDGQVGWSPPRLAFNDPEAPVAVQAAQVLIMLVDVETVNALYAGLLPAVRDVARVKDGTRVVPVPTGVCRWDPLPELARWYPIQTEQVSAASSGGRSVHVGHLRTEPLERLSPPRRDDVFCTLVELIARELGWAGE